VTPDDFVYVTGPDAFILTLTGEVWKAGGIKKRFGPKAHDSIVFPRREQVSGPQQGQDADCRAAGNVERPAPLPRLLFGAEPDRRDLHAQRSSWRHVHRTGRRAVLCHVVHKDARRLRRGLLPDLHRWYESGGIQKVVAYLHALDLDAYQRRGLFDPKLPPPRTEWWHKIVEANVSTEDTMLQEAIAELAKGDSLAVSANELQTLHGRDKDRWGPLYLMLHDPTAQQGMAARFYRCVMPR
jgi:hypothetical protein